jgi:hypothetical protein
LARNALKRFDLSQPGLSLTLKQAVSGAAGHDDSSHARIRARVQAVISRGAYESVEQVVDAALVAVEQRTVPDFAGAQAELDTLFAEGLASRELPEDEFWRSVNTRTEAMLAAHKTGSRS